MNDVPIEDALDCGRNKKLSKRRDASPDLSTRLYAELQKRDSPLLLHQRGGVEPDGALEVKSGSIGIDLDTSNPITTADHDERFVPK